MKKIILFTAIVCCTGFLKAQSVAINSDGSTANSSALLDIKSNTKGLLIPRLTKAEKYAVIAPANGLLIYQTSPDSIGFYYYQNFRWNWLTDNYKNDTTYWGLHGNLNTTPPSNSNIGGIDFANDTYLGTTDQHDVSMLAGGNELLRLKQFATGGRIGMSNRNPEYSLDLRITELATETQIEGMRIIPKSLFNTSNPDNKNKGLVIGNSATNANESVIWNHGNNIDGAIRMGLDIFDNNIQPAFNITGWGQGIYQRNPKYLLDIHSLSQFGPANFPATNKNGIRITYRNQGLNNTLDNGLFMGVDLGNSSFKSYIWNYADGQNGNSPDKAIYFGVGSDYGNLYSGIPTMELQDGKIAMGHLISPTQNFPSTLNITTDYASGVAKNGISIIKHEWPYTTESAYLGTDVNDNMNLYKYNGGNIFIGNPIDYTLTINANNQVGIKTNTPNADLQFNDAYANNKLVLHNNFYGNIPLNEHDFYGFGVNLGSLRYQVPRPNTAHVFYAGNINGNASNELMRITGEGYVGIGTNNPSAPLEFFTAPVNRKIVLSSGGPNNDHNFVGFGHSPDGGLRYQVPSGIFDHVFYKGDNGGGSSTELFRISGSGDVGVGANFPQAYGHFGTNRILEIKNSLSGAADVQSHLILSTYGQSGSLGGVTWAGLNLSGEQRTGFIGNSYETANQTKLSFYTRSNAGILNESFYIQGTGNAWLQGTLTQASDARLKKNIQPISSALNKLQQINGYTYNWINEQRDNEEQIGLLAQEVQQNYPQLVRQNDKGELSVNYTGLVPVLLEGIKEQQKQIENLKEQNLQQQLQIESILKKIK